jgi:hypothetical protein
VVLAVIGGIGGSSILYLMSQPDSPDIVTSGSGSTSHRCVTFNISKFEIIKPANTCHFGLTNVILHNVSPHNVSPHNVILCTQCHSMYTMSFYVHNVILCTQCHSMYTM